MTFILTIYFVLAVNVVSMQKSMPDLATCKAEAERIISEFNPSSAAGIHVECKGTKTGFEV